MKIGIRHITRVKLLERGKVKIILSVFLGLRSQLNLIASLGG